RSGGSTMSTRVAIMLFMLLVVGGGLLIGALTPPGSWYQALAKPAFNPPGWIFAPVWTVLYVMIAVAGWRIWRREPGGAAMKLWWMQLVLNFLWSPIFFALHQIGLALVVILALLVTILAFIAAAWRPDRLAAGFFVPYAAWVMFASTLNTAIWQLN